MKSLSRHVILKCVSSTAAQTWSFLTNHARVILCIEQDPGIRLREIGDRVGVTERAAHRIVDELVEGGYVSRTRSGRRNHYTLHRQMPVSDRIARLHTLGDLLTLLTPPEPSDVGDEPVLAPARA